MNVPEESLTAEEVRPIIEQCQGLVDIGIERVRQITMGYTPEHDRRHDYTMLVFAAEWLLGGRPPVDMGAKWGMERNPADPRNDLVRAGALIAAAIDRLDTTNQQIEEQR